MTCSLCGKGKLWAMAYWKGKSLCVTCLDLELDRAFPGTTGTKVPVGEMWVVAVQNGFKHKAKPFEELNLHTYPSWRAAYTAAQRVPGWRHIECIYPPPGHVVKTGE